MKIIEITALSNGAHRNQEGNFNVVPAGWAVIPDDIVIPDTYPFVEVTAEDGIVTELTPGTLPKPEPEPAQEPTVDERVTAMEDENAMLKAQIAAQSEQMDFYEDCIAEMASIVYA